MMNAEEVMKRKNTWKIKVCGMAAVLVAGAFPYSVAATPGAGITKYTSAVAMSSALPTAGFSLTMSRQAAEVSGQAIIASAQPMVTEHAVPVVASEYADMLVANVNNYVNIRSEASKDSQAVGKLYKNNVGRVIGEENGWYQIESGNVTGYVSSEYVIVADEEKIRSAGRRIAVVTTQTLFVRKGPSTDTAVIDMVPENEDLTVVDESVEGWIGVTVDGGNGFVSADYVELSTEYTYAESKEEEMARLKKEEEARKAAEAAAKKKRSASSSSGSSSSDSSSYTPPTGSTGADVATFACQFVGNPYVYGGTSLTNGADCSGFVMSVYANYGVSLPHSSTSLRRSGYGVSTSDMQPGDIVCYSGHVGIYIGGGRIVHASNRRDGIKISNVSYRAILAVRRIF